ncbi:MAG: polyamine aminopropyltransferase [Burkholderiales bacterium]|nr:polyamine aminopropyltransferase [Burkholderiales bacterium]
MSRPAGELAAPAGAAPLPPSEVLNRALLASVFVIAACGLVYELIAAAASTYLLGDSITQFSVVIGVYLAAMGAGSYASRHVVSGIVSRFIDIELIIAVAGGFSAALMFLSFAWMGPGFRVVLYGLVVLVGFLVGLEIPLVMRILKERLGFRDLVAQVLTFDYLGALAVSIAFPLLLAPRLGLIRTAFLFGILNAVVALWAVWLFRAQLRRPVAAAMRCAAVTALLAAGFASAERLTQLAEEQIYADQIVHAESSRGQRIVLTRWREDLRLYLNGNLQFSSLDEYRYHEALVHPGLAALPHARRVLVLGGGDGLAVREVLRYPQVESVTLVDLDPAITRLFADAPPLRALNADALNSPKVKVVNADAFIWLEQSREQFDFVVADFPDPSNHSLGKLYTTSFYAMLKRRLSARGMAVIQSTSPLYARRSFWCVVTTLEAAGFAVTPYHALVPSFGEWGFIIASNAPYEPPPRYPFPMRFLTPELHPALFRFPADMARVPTEVNRLNNQALVTYFESEWRRGISE